MKFHLPFSANEIFWALTFAGYLVLLVVLMGRDRVRRFPWFTGYTALIAFRLLTVKMLMGRLAQIPMAEFFIGLALLIALVNVAMLLELARKAFAGIRRTAWVAGALTLMALGAVVLAFWGKWPAWQTLTAGGGLIANLQLLNLIALKAGLLLDVETVLLAVAIFLFGSRFHAGWTTHIRRIAIGLFAVSLSMLTAEAIAQIMGRNAHPKTMAEAQHFLDLRDRIFFADSAILVLALIWWIWNLWKDEPEQNGTGQDKPLAANPVPELSAPDATVSQPE